MVGLIVKPLSIFFLALIPFFFTGSFNIIIDLVNYLFTVLAPAIAAIVGLFPAAPTLPVASETPDTALLSAGVSALCWLLPVAFLVQMVGYMMAAVIIYFTMAPLARWAKLMT